MRETKSKKSTGKRGGQRTLILKLTPNQARIIEEALHRRAVGLSGMGFTAAARSIFGVWRSVAQQITRQGGRKS